MELTNKVIDLGYKHAWLYLKKMGRRDIDHRDIAHEVFVRAARLKEQQDGHLENKIRWLVKSVFRDFHTDKTSRKKDALLKASHKPIEHATWDENVVDAAEEIKLALLRLHELKPHWFDLLVDGRSAGEIAAERKVSRQAVNCQQIHARAKLQTIIDDAA